MAQKGFGLQALVTELNHTIRRDLPSHRFVATTPVSVDAIENRIEVWNGGNPACPMLDAEAGDPALGKPQPAAGRSGFTTRSTRIPNALPSIATRRS